MERAVHLIRCLSFFLARWNVSLVCSHTPGSQNRITFLPATGSRGKQDTDNPSRQITGVLVTRNAGLDKHRLDHLVQTFFLNGLADSTHKVYRSGYFLTTSRLILYTRVESKATPTSALPHRAG